MKESINNNEKYCPKCGNKYTSSFTYCPKCKVDLKTKTFKYGKLETVLILILIALLSISLFLNRDNLNKDNNAFKLIGFAAIVFFVIYSYTSGKKNYHKKTVDNKHKTGKEEKEVKKLINAQDFVNNIYKDKKVTGVYILWNSTKNKYYVGQAQNTTQRVKNHFVGKGNPDVYFDYRTGDVFGVDIVALNETNFSNLDDLEKHYINKYRANITGYNRTKGNG